MEPHLASVIRNIKSGASKFSPNDDTPEEIAKFQLIAKAIIHARDLGYIENVNILRDHTRPQGGYRAIIVQGGLTYAGETALLDISSQPTPIYDELTSLLSRIDSPSIKEKWEKTLYRRKTDPSGAITAAKSMLESTLKWIIEQNGGTPTDNNKELFKNAIQYLQLDIKGTAIEKTIDGLNLVIWAVGDMRNRKGDAHGSSTSSPPPTPAEAGLCVNMSGAVVLYLLEQYNSRTSTKL